jgi:hypothetical protein
MYQDDGDWQINVGLSSSSNVNPSLRHYWTELKAQGWQANHMPGVDGGDIWKVFVVQRQKREWKVVATRFISPSKGKDRLVGQNLRMVIGPTDFKNVSEENSDFFLYALAAIPMRKPGSNEAKNVPWIASDVVRMRSGLPVRLELTLSPDELSTRLNALGTSTQASPETDPAQTAQDLATQGSGVVFGVVLVSDADVKHWVIKVDGQKIDEFGPEKGVIKKLELHAPAGTHKMRIAAWKTETGAPVALEWEETFVPGVKPFFSLYVSRDWKMHMSRTQGKG